MVLRLMSTPWYRQLLGGSAFRQKAQMDTTGPKVLYSAGSWSRILRLIRRLFSNLLEDLKHSEANHSGTTHLLQGHPLLYGRETRNCKKEGRNQQTTEAILRPFMVQQERIIAEIWRRTQPPCRFNICAASSFKGGNQVYSHPLMANSNSFCGPFSNAWNLMLTA